jgi:DnaJ-class molecular chaperone
MKPCLECDGHGYRDGRDGDFWRRDRCVFCHGTGTATIEDGDDDTPDELQGTEGHVGTGATDAKTGG